MAPGILCLLECQVRKLARYQAPADIAIVIARARERDPSRIAIRITDPAGKLSEASRNVLNLAIRRPEKLACQFNVLGSTFALQDAEIRIRSARKSYKTVIKNSIGVGWCQERIQCERSARKPYEST